MGEDEFCHRPSSVRSIRILERSERRPDMPDIKMHEVSEAFAACWAAAIARQSGWERRVNQDESQRPSEMIDAEFSP